MVRSTHHCFPIKASGITLRSSAGSSAAAPAAPTAGRSSAPVPRSSRARGSGRDTAGTGPGPRSQPLRRSGVPPAVDRCGAGCSLAYDDTTHTIASSSVPVPYPALPKNLLSVDIGEAPDPPSASPAFPLIPKAPSVNSPFMKKPTAPGSHPRLRAQRKRVACHPSLYSRCILTYRTCENHWSVGSLRS